MFIKERCYVKCSSKKMHFDVRDHLHTSALHQIQTFSRSLSICFHIERIFRREFSKFDFVLVGDDVISSTWREFLSKILILKMFKVMCRGERNEVSSARKQNQEAPNEVAAWN